MSEVNNMALEVAAYKHGSKYFEMAKADVAVHSFTSGAKWQKEQNNELLDLLIEIKNELYPSVGEIHVSLFDKIREMIIKHTNNP